MNSKMTTNSQLSTTEPKKQKLKVSKQTTRTGTESQKWRSYGGLISRKGVGGECGKREGTENKKYKWWVQNRQEKVKNSIVNAEAKELLCMTHGDEVSVRGILVRRMLWEEGE